MLKISKKILAILLIAIIFISCASSLVQAAFEITEATIVEIGQAEYHLKHYNSTLGKYTYVICYVVGYYNNGTFYPAYCLNKDNDGVGTLDSYAVDVDSLIGNDIIWRAVKNGYPYKTAAEMGVASDFDAFVVTKCAIYCLTGQSNVDQFYAEDDDPEAQAMLAALRNLVSIGWDGTETYSTEVKVTQIGDLVEEGNYYSLTYKVNSGSTISSYNVTSVSGLSDGDLVTDVDGNIRTSFSSGENFKIKILKSNLTTDKDISVQVEANLKSYPMFYGKTRISGTQNYMLTASAYENISASTSTNLKVNTGKIEIYKVDDETGEGIDNTTFEIYNSNSELVGTYTTDANGKIECSDLYPGNYLVKEICSNENYILEENSEYSIDVSYNETSTITIENEHKKGDLTIYKIDKDNNSVSLGGVGFELYREETGELVGTYYTDADGKIEIKGLRTGNYLLKEISTNQWYNLAEDREIEIKWNEVTETQVENELQKGQIKVIKVDKDNNEVKLANVVFEVQDVDGNVLETITTDENGEAYTQEYVLRDFQKLRIKEIQTDEMYELNNEIVEVTLEANQIKDITFENEKIRGNIQILKTTSGESEITGIGEGEALEGVVFEVYDSTGTLVDTITTDEDGMAITKELEKGVYTVKEVSTNEWYLLNTTKYTAEISTNHQIVTIEIENEPITPEEEIEKTGVDEASKNEEITYNINVKNTGNVALDDFTWEDEIPTDYIRVTKMNLGTYNQENTYNLYYKTNFTDEYILLFEDLSTLIDEEIDFTKELSDNEYITNIKLEFGTVDVDFSSEVETTLYTIVNEDVTRDDVFENKVTLTSNYNGYNLTKESSWKTKIYEILPLTGM